MAKRYTFTDRSEEFILDKFQDTKIWKTVKFVNEADSAWSTFIKIIAPLTTVAAPLVVVFTELAKSPLAALAGFTSGIIGASIFWYHEYRKRAVLESQHTARLLHKIEERRWQQISDTSQRSHLAYQKFDQTAIYGKKGEVVAWDFDLELKYRTSKGRPIEYVVHNLWYDGEKKDLKAVAINKEGVERRIIIEDELLAHDGKFNFMVRFDPPLRPGETRSYRYQAQLVGAKRKRHPYLATGWRTEKGYDTTNFSVQFDPQMLPRGGKIYKVYWPGDIGKEAEGFIKIRTFELLPNHNELDVSFTREQVNKLTGDWERRRYGLWWEWPDETTAQSNTPVTK